MKTTGKNRKTVLFALAAAALVIAVLILTYAGIATEKYSLPQDYVNKNSREDSSGLLIRNTIIRYAVKANVTILNTSNMNITVGVASQTDELNYGNLPQNITMRKFVDLNNSENSPVKICIIERGDVSGHLYVTQGNSMIIPAKEKGQLELGFNATDARVYSGEMDIVVRKPKYDLLSYFVSAIGC